MKAKYELVKVSPDNVPVLSITGTVKLHTGVGLIIQVCDELRAKHSLECSEWPQFYRNGQHYRVVCEFID